MSSTPIDGKLLKGLRVKTAETREMDNGNGKKIKKSFPVERTLKPEDVLDWKDLGDTVVIVAKDGQKHRVDKAGAGEKGSGAAKGGGANAS